MYEATGGNFIPNQKKYQKYPTTLCNKTLYKSTSESFLRDLVPVDFDIISNEGANYILLYQKKPI